MTQDSKLVQVDIAPELPQMQRSVHNRPSVSRDITIYHTLLVFTVDS